MEKWTHWRTACAEYFANFKGGRYDHAAQHWFIFVEEEIYSEPDTGDLVIGSAGCDGISFCFRKNMPGVWAYYPIEEDHIIVALSLAELEIGWLNGSIKV